MDKNNTNHHAFIQSSTDALSGKTKGFRKILPFLGPAFIAAVAYIDPGNFATNIAAGSQYGYMLLWVILVSNIMAMLIQAMSAKLGIATGMNLPEVSRQHFPKAVSYGLWIQGELVIMATDLAEFIGAALGIYLLFDIPMLPSAIIAAIGSFAILALQTRGVRSLEAGIAGLVFIVVVSFGIQVFYAEPELTPLLEGLLLPKFDDVNSVLLAAGILGATVMPHAIYLHSALTQRRVIGKDDHEKKKIFKYELFDILIAMSIAGVINACMLIMAAALFQKQGIFVEDLDVVFEHLGTMVGPFAAILFAIGLLTAGLSSSTVGTMSGDVIMQGFIQKKIPLYLRRLITVTPPLIIIMMGVNPTKALVMSQVILSFGIAFALVPLIIFTSNKKIMGSLVNKKITTFIGWVISIIIIALNIFLLYQTIFG